MTATAIRAMTTNVPTIMLKPMVTVFFSSSAFSVSTSIFNMMYFFLLWADYSNLVAFITWCVSMLSDFFPYSPWLQAFLWSIYDEFIWIKWKPWSCACGSSRGILLGSAWVCFICLSLRGGTYVTWRGKRPTQMAIGIPWIMGRGNKDARYWRVELMWAYSVYFRERPWHW